MGVPRLLSGRLPTAPDEVALDWTVADQLHERVGDTYRATLLSNENGSSVTVPAPGGRHRCQHAELPSVQR